MSDRITHGEMLKISFDAWKFQIDSFWTRSSSFAVFELGVAAGLWQVFLGRYYLTSSAIAVGGILLTAVWLVNNSKLHNYILYYQERIKHFENLAGLLEEDTVFTSFERLRKCDRFPGQYHYYIQGVPLLFLVGWLWMLCWSVCNLRVFLHF
jgi:hypothetical protein